jgi:NAD(P)-dependent dehydrogenase (short-subunit alcohol dehydrogenase family)
MTGYSSALLGGKTILVTGAGRGIGRACAQGIAACGARVLAVSRTQAELDALAREAEGEIEPWVADVLSTEFTQRVAELEQLDGLLNNAGTNRVGYLAEQTEEDFDRVLDLNVRSIWRTCQAALGPLKRAGGGSVVNMSSQMGHVGSPRRSLYCMSKHAVEGLSRAMAVELAEDGIRVNTVAPTFVRTPLTEPMLDDPAFSAWVMGMIPMRKLATPEDIANACVFLLSPLSGSTTGSCLKVDGGWTAQ